MKKLSTKVNSSTSAGTKADSDTLPIAGLSSHNSSKPIVGGSCPKCDGKGWYFVNEWIGTLQGQKDCNCINKNQTKC
jgi:hypothetical protein